MNKIVHKVKKFSDAKLHAGLVQAARLSPENIPPNLCNDPAAIYAIKSKLEGSRAVPPTGQVALYFDALLAVTRGEVLAIMATTRQEAEALYLALTYKAP